MVGLAEVALAQARPAESVALAERAVKLREAGVAPAAELAEARFVLARALAESGGVPPRSVELARQARDAYRDLGEGSAKARTEVEAWLDNHGDADD